MSKRKNGQRLTQVLRLRPEADQLLEAETVRTGRKKQDVGHEWLMLAAKMKRLLPEQRKEPTL